MKGNIIRNAIVELDLNEIEAVAGGATYTATLSYTSTSASANTSTYTYTAPVYVRPISTTLSSPLLSAPKLI
ncbi:MAG: hypothetical protein U1E60_27525 [Reyranellaceae bacterium]